MKRKGAKTINHLRPLRISTNLAVLLIGLIACSSPKGTPDNVAYPNSMREEKTILIIYHQLPASRFMMPDGILWPTTRPEYDLKNPLSTAAQIIVETGAETSQRLAFVQKLGLEDPLPLLNARFISEAKSRYPTSNLEVAEPAEVRDPFLVQSHDFALHFETTRWGLEDQRSQIFLVYHVRARIVDVTRHRVIKEKTCEFHGPQFKTYEELSDNNGERIKRELSQAAEVCATLFDMHLRNEIDSLGRGLQ
jgi:hypothetical protein